MDMKTRANTIELTYLIEYAYEIHETRLFMSQTNKDDVPFTFNKQNKTQENLILRDGMRTVVDQTRFRVRRVENFSIIYGIFNM